MQIENIPIGLIDEPTNAHRLEMDPQALQELADSIRIEGLKNPISVFPKPDGRYEIIAGHRRYTACRMNGFVEVPAMIREADHNTIHIERFIENAQRSNLSPMEEALALTEFMEVSGLEPAEIAKRLGKSASWIGTRVELMGLPDALKEHVHAGRIAIASALALAKVDDVAHRDYLAQYAIQGGASAVVIREWVNQWLVHKANPQSDTPPAPTWQPGDAVVVITIPCAVCRSPEDHRNMAIVRVCSECQSALAQSHAAPPATGG